MHPCPLPAHPNQINPLVYHDPTTTVNHHRLSRYPNQPTASKASHLYGCTHLLIQPLHGRCTAAQLHLPLSPVAGARARNRMHALHGYCREGTVYTNNRDYISASAPVHPRLQAHHVCHGLTTWDSSSSNTHSTLARISSYTLDNEDGGCSAFSSDFGASIIHAYSESDAVCGLV